MSWVCHACVHRNENDLWPWCGYCSTFRWNHDRAPLSNRVLLELDQRTYGFSATDVTGKRIDPATIGRPKREEDPLRGPPAAGTGGG